MASNHGTLYITGHDDKNEAVIHSEDALQWKPADPSGSILVAKVYSTGVFPAQLSDKSDIQKHNDRVASGDNSIGLKQGITSHFCLFGPGATFPIHRTVTLDYGVCTIAIVFSYFSPIEKVLACLYWILNNLLPAVGCSRRKFGNAIGFWRVTDTKCWGCGRSARNYAWMDKPKQGQMGQDYVCCNSCGSYQNQGYRTR